MKRLQQKSGNNPVPVAKPEPASPKLTPSKLRLLSLRAVTQARGLKALVLAALSVLGGIALLRPQVSIDPSISLDPGDPFETQFSLTNQNRLLDATEINASCEVVSVRTSHNVGLLGLPPRPNPTIPRLGPQEKATITCPPWIGGLGKGAGNVTAAYIAIDVAYKQLIHTQHKYPFKGVIDSQNGVHWTAITLEQMEYELAHRGSL